MAPRRGRSNMVTVLRARGDRSIRAYIDPDRGTISREIYVNPDIFVRDRKDNQIRAFLNSCRHRGMKVCRYDQGNSLVFTCPFHAWTYDTRGRLVGMGFGNNPDAYNGEVNKEEWGLAQVAQFKNF